ncbi:uncharacterized protein LOC130524143 isoform X1 [Takifugu flavidus]|uniref:uncharacterized protein LOC130524143 isoform X1 n=1 Tax=Takifugu flavidus TaxID=433684 RepID=UPI002544AD96|nr:uncharacterized protein LOC130524143 isoform X1 [Takifugu flavidus]
MHLMGWFVWWIFLILCMSACSSEVFKDGSQDVTCSQGLSDCTMKDEMSLSLANSETVDVVNVTPHFKLCCKDRAPCTLCMAIDLEMKINQETSKEQLEYSEEASNTKAASVKVCYTTMNTIPMCKKVEFTINPAALTQQTEAKISIVVTQPVGVTFSSHVMVYSYKSPHVLRNVVVPSLAEVCSQEMGGHLEECEVPKLSTVINIEANQVDLQSSDGNRSLPSMCVQYESNGRCKLLKRKSISLHSVTPCTCFEAWNDNAKGHRRSRICPFNKTDFFMRNVWQNVSVSLGQGQIHNGRPMLRWNLSAPCRLEGEVWPCCPLKGCKELQGFQQHLTNGTWRQNIMGHWERTGVFEDLNLQLPPCLMVKVRGRDSALGPYCNVAAGRWRWSLLIVGVMLLLALTVLMSYLLDFIKEWVWSWRRGTFVKIGGNASVLLLSPPDVDDGVSKSMGKLSDLLRRHGFSVVTDIWSRNEQCEMGPIPWFYSQMMEANYDRVVLVLTPGALERAHKWVQQGRTKEEEGDHPHSAVFMAGLFRIYTNTQLQRTPERFILVMFDSDPCRKSRLPKPLLPKPLLGLPLFCLPSQNKALLKELTVGGAGGPPTGTKKCRHPRPKSEI